MKPLTLSFLVLSSIILFAVLATCEDCRKQFDEEIKNSSSIRVLSWVNEIVKTNSYAFVDSLDNSAGIDSLTELSDEDLEAVKHMIMSSYKDFGAEEDTLSKTLKKDDSVFVHAASDQHGQNNLGIRQQR
jgi:hypothetical protein